MRGTKSEQEKAVTEVGGEWRVSEKMLTFKFVPDKLDRLRSGSSILSLMTFLGGVDVDG